MNSSTWGGGIRLMIEGWDSGMEVSSKNNSVPADGRSYMTLELNVDEPDQPTVQLRLRGPGSFDPHIRRKRIEAPVVNGRAVVHLHASRRPGQARVLGPGLDHRVEFTPTGLGQQLLFEWVPTLALSLVFALVIRTYAFASFYIPTGSMADTMLIGDLFLTDNFSYRVLHQEPGRGDIVVFEQPQTGETLIKRVIGLPGDTVRIIHGSVLINGETLDEDYIREPPFRDYGPVTVPADSYFVMGDNRNNSADSRVWGMLPRANLKGRAAVVVWPPARFHLLDRGDYPE